MPVGADFTLCKLPPRLLEAAVARVFPGSSAVEQPAVNRLVAGSNPARGAKSQFLPNWACCGTRPALRWPLFVPRGQRGCLKLATNSPPFQVQFETTKLSRRRFS